MLVGRFGFSWRAVSFGEAAFVVWRAVSFGEAAVVLLCFGCRLPVSFLPLYLIWRDVRLGPDHRVYWRGRGRISFCIYFWGAVDGWP
jgi:hypothetical protein